VTSTSSVLLVQLLQNYDPHNLPPTCTRWIDWFKTHAYLLTIYASTTTAAAQRLRRVGSAANLRTCRKYAKAALTTGLLDHILAGMSWHDDAPLEADPADVSPLTIQLNPSPEGNTKDLVGAAMCCLLTVTSGLESSEVCATSTLLLRCTAAGSTGEYINTSLLGRGLDLIMVIPVTTHELWMPCRF
jgi:hypothetical protein